MSTNPLHSVSASRSRAAALPVGARTLAREAGLVLAGTAAIALIGQVSLPLPFTPVPVTLGTLAALGVGGVLGTRRGIASVAVLALAAALGAPVLAGWSSGVGASFGYVLGYGLAAAVAGRATDPARTADGARRAVHALPVRVLLMLAASAVVYVPGLLWLKAATGLDWSAVLAIGLAPFVIGDVLKSVAAALLPARRL